MAKTFVLSFVKNGVAKNIFQHVLPQEVQRHKKSIEKNPEYNGGVFQVRTLEGFKKVSIL